MPQTAEFEVLCKTARAQLTRGRADEAIKSLEQARALDDDDADLHETLATAHFMVSNFQAAITHYQHVVRLDPKRATPYINMGAVFNKLGEYKKAIELLRKGIQFDRKASEAYYNLGISYRQLQQWSLSLSAYREAIRLKPQMAEAYQNIANVYVEMGNLRQAISHFQKALEIRPDFERAKRGLEKAQLAMAADRKAESPFGKLVDIPAPDKQGSGTEIPTDRVLSADDREHDRHVIFQLGEQIALETRHLRDFVRSDIMPTLRIVLNAVSGTAGSDVVDAHRKLKLSQKTFEGMSRKVQRMVQTLREHDQQMR